MPGIKISALPPIAAPALTDIFPVVQAGVTYKETVQQLTTLIGSSLTGTFVPVAGGTMTGPLILNADATLPLQAVTYEQLQTVAAGFTVILACVAATTGNLNVIQAGAGVGATLTDNSGTFAAFSTDGVSPALGSRILVKNQTLTQHNGVYVLTTNGDGLAIPYVLTRATDYDQAPAEVKSGTLVAVNTGTVNATTSWLETATVAIMDTDPILFSQFTFSPTAFLLKANNLSDLNNVATALINLGLGAPTGAGNVVLQNTPTLITPILGAASATSLTFSSTAGIIGTTTNNNAAAGSVGEYFSSIVASGAGLVLVSTVARDVTTLALSAGDYNVWGNVGFNFSVGGQSTFGWSSLVSATPPDASLYTAIRTGLGSNQASGIGFCIPMRRYSLAVPTTIYLSVSTVFASGTGNAYGALYARRIR